jgi:L-asparaginase
MKAKIRVLACGGTIVMEKNPEGLLVPPDNDRALASLLALEPRLQEEYDLNFRFLTNIDSSNMTPAIWDQMAQAIYEEYDQYDGFVVTHGTDTMAYTTSALSFALQGIGKPVVFTGAQIPGHFLESDARRNFINAVKIAAMDCSGVMILFGNALYLGCRVTKVSHFRLNAFESVNVPVLGKIGSDIQFSPYLQKRHHEKVHLAKGFDPHVSVISLVPGMSLDLMIPLLNHPLRGIVLLAYGTGNLSESHLSFLSKAQEVDIPVVIRSQCLEGSTKMSLYETGKKALLFDVIEAYDMSLESTLTKFMWALDKAIPYERMREAMHENRAGEINPNRQIGAIWGRRN